MTNNKNDGGAAFPGGDSEAGEPYYKGMSLRDWFAGMAMMGFAASPSNKVGQWTPEEVAGDAYGYADAMLAERESQ